jgi:hypothetical protein
MSTTTAAANITTQLRANWETTATSRSAARALREWRTRHPELDSYGTPLEVTEAIHSASPRHANTLVGILLVEQRAGCTIARDAVLNAMLPLVMTVLRATRSNYTHTDDDVSELLTAAIDILRDPRDVGDWPITSFYNTLYCRALRRRGQRNRASTITATVNEEFDFAAIAEPARGGDAGTELIHVLAYAVRIGTISSADASLLGTKAFLDRAVSTDAAQHKVTERAMRKRHARLVERLAAAAPELADSFVGDYTAAA